MHRGYRYIKPTAHDTLFPAGFVNRIIACCLALCFACSNHKSAASFSFTRSDYLRVGLIFLVRKFHGDFNKIVQNSKNSLNDSQSECSINIIP